MKATCLRLVPLVLLLFPLAARPQSTDWRPIQEYIYAGSRLLVIHPPKTSGGFITNMQATLIVPENAGRISIPVELTASLGKGSPVEARVKYSTVSESARSDSDFKPTSGLLVFPPRSPSGTTLQIEVQILDDSKSEPEKSFSVLLSDATGASIVLASRKIVITDDDSFPSASDGDGL